MYLILTDPEARTVRVEEECANGFRGFFQAASSVLVGIDFNYVDAEAFAKELAIKENLVYTPVTEL